MSLAKRPHARSRINIAQTWDKVAATWANKHRARNDADDLVWGPFGPRERDARLLPQLQGARILVLGCGAGADLTYAAKGGAAVTGLDISSAQLALARARLEIAGVSGELRQRDLNNLAPDEFAPETFDIAIANYSLQYITALDDLFAKVTKALRPGGSFVFSLDHPILLATYETRPKRDAFLRRKTFERFDYLDERTLYWSFHTPSGPVPAYSYHRTVSSLVNCVCGAGLRIQRLLEPSPTLRNPVGRYRQLRQLAQRLPFTLVVCAVRP